MSTEHRFKDEWLVRAVLALPGITSTHIEECRRLAKPFLSQGLVQMGLITLPKLGEAVQKLYKIPLANVASRDVDKMAVSMLPERICQKLMVFPLALKGEYIEVAMANPLDMDAQRDMQVLSGRTVLPLYCLPDTIQTLIAEFYSGDNVLKEILTKLDVQDDVQYLGAEETTDDLNTYTSEQVNYQPVIKLANSLIAKAVTLGASDIHIEHDEKNSYVRYRIDGILRRVMNLPKSLAGGPLISRIKIMANLDVADHNRPQDGRAKVSVSGREIALRVSTLPTNFGEKAVIRILDPTSTTIPFEQMGFPKHVIARLENLLTAAQGIILVTGPTGSGKTTTLYTALSMLKSEDTNIVTVEDPIEYRLPGINQVQVNDKAGLSFSSVLRSVLRQDPDVILIGEIRDAETANIAFQAAITGHTVFSTLHTNDSISAISRLHDMGVERFKLAPGLLAITAQRLVRRLCKACRAPVEEAEFDKDIEKLLINFKLSKTYWKPVGCEQCNFLGYRGRLAVVELLELNTRLRERIAAGDNEEALRKVAFSEKMLYPILLDTLWHLSSGDTSLEEVIPYLTGGTDKDSGHSQAKSTGPSTEEAPPKHADEIEIQTTQFPDVLAKQIPPLRKTEEKTSPNKPAAPAPRKPPVENKPPADEFESYGEISFPESAPTPEPEETDNVEIEPTHHDGAPSIDDAAAPVEKMLIEDTNINVPGQPPTIPVELESMLPEPELTEKPKPQPSRKKPAEPPPPEPEVAEEVKQIPPQDEPANLPAQEADEIAAEALQFMIDASVERSSEAEQAELPSVETPSAAEPEKPAPEVPSVEPAAKIEAAPPMPVETPPAGPAQPPAPVETVAAQEVAPPQEIVPEAPTKAHPLAIESQETTKEIAPEPVESSDLPSKKSEERPKKTHKKGEPKAAEEETVLDGSKIEKAQPETAEAPVAPEIPPAPKEKIEPIPEKPAQKLEPKEIPEPEKTPEPPAAEEAPTPSKKSSEKKPHKHKEEKIAAPEPETKTAPPAEPPKPATQPVPAPMEAADKGPADAEPAYELPTKKGEILIVDDNATLRLLLRCILEDAGFTVKEAKDGVHAMEILLNKTPDVMLLDLDMPKLSGEEVIKRVHQSMNLFPIIVLTTNSDDRSQVDALSLGADDYIIKPFIPSVVLARVRAAMRRTGK